MMPGTFLSALILAAALAPQVSSAPAAAPQAATLPASPGGQPQTSPPPSAVQRSAPDSYTIGSNDQLAITVFGEDDLTNKYRVDESGMVTFPLIGRILAAGKTIARFQDDLTKMLANGYLKNPQVRVDIETYKSQSVYISGSVRQPGRVTMMGQLTLSDALAQAGSPTSDAGDDVQIAHRKAAGADSDPAGPDEDVQHVSLRGLVLGRGDIALQDGDRVYVTPAQHFTITGQIRNSGSYVWEPNLTVDMAIARAGGLTERGSTRGIEAHRMVEGKMKDVDLKMQDAVLPGDVITIKQRIF